MIGYFVHMENVLKENNKNTLWNKSYPSVERLNALISFITTFLFTFCVFCDLVFILPVNTLPPTVSLNSDCVHVVLRTALVV